MDEVACARRSNRDLVTVTTPSNPYGLPDQEDASGAEERAPPNDANTSNRNYLAKRTKRPTWGDLGVKKRDTGETHIAGPTPSAELPVWSTREPRADKGKYVWGRFKRIVVRSASP